MLKLLIDVSTMVINPVYINGKERLSHTSFTRHYEICFDRSL
jgi:hypothetical protein